MSVVFRSITASTLAILTACSLASAATKPTATASKILTAAPAKSANSAPVDISSQPLADEITHAVVRLKLFPAPNGRFGPNTVMTGKELSAVLAKAAVSFPLVFKNPAPSAGTALTREKAVTLVVQALTLWGQRMPVLMEISAVKDPLRYFYEDNGFKDGKSVSKSAREAYAIAIYHGLIPDTATLQPTGKCTRAYAAALVARALPGVNGITGLLLDCNGAFLPAAGGIRLKLENQVGDQKSFIFPIASRMPSRAFSQAPGLVSINPNELVVKMRRAGFNPMVIVAQRVEGNMKIESAPAIVVSEEDALKVRQLAKSSLILQTWRVGVCNFTRTKPQPAPAQPEQTGTPNLNPLDPAF